MPACAETAAMHSWLKAALPLVAVWDLVLGTGHQFWLRRNQDDLLEQINKNCSHAEEGHDLSFMCADGLHR